MSGLEVEARDLLRDIELHAAFRAEVGQTVALVGPSGAGKSTLLKVVAGLHRPAEGRVTVASETWLDTATSRNLDPDQRSCGFLFQDYALFPHLSAWRNVAFGLEGSRPTRRDRAVAELERFSVGHLAGVRPGELSGGERQRVALARALVRRPKVMLLDEPLTALDSGTRRRAEAELAATIAEAGIPVVFVTHSFAEATALADRVLVIDDGAIIQTGTPTEVSGSPHSGFVADLTGAVVAPGTARSGTAGSATVVLDDGGFEVRAAEAAAGRVEVSIYPWEVSLAGPGEEGGGANSVPARVLAATVIGDRARVVLSTPRGMTAEVPVSEVERLGLEPGSEVEARWAPERTRVYPAR